MNNADNNTSDHTFFDYLFQETARKSLGLVLLCLCQFIVFKFLYPYPDFFSDSYSYIDAAARHLDANIWPIGYSRFLLLFHHVTHSATALNLFQYLFFELAALYFYRTFLYLFSLKKLTKNILCAFLFYNPLNLYLANFVSSDGLFAALSLIWLTGVVWTIYRPNLYHVLVLSVSCFIAFTFRYNAMYYPIITLPVFLLIRKGIAFKSFAILLGPLLITPFIIFSANAAKEMSGTSQFPPILGGWQWANNALYIREYVQEDTVRFPNAEMAELDALARTYYRHVPPEDRVLSTYVGNFFIKEWDAPLKVYMQKHYPDSLYANNTIPWAKTAPLFKQYGIYLIKRHPLAFLNHFMVSNTKNYFLPPLEKLEVYNTGHQSMWETARQWFHYKHHRVWAISYTFHGRLFAAYPAFFLLLNLFFIWNFFSFVRRNGFYSSDRRFATVIGTISLLLVINCAFSIFANIVVFRYQIFPMIALLAIVLVLNDFLDRDRTAIRHASTT